MPRTRTSAARRISMHIHTLAWLSGLSLVAAVSLASAQTTSRYGATATQIQREPAAAMRAKPVNDGARFQLICRGGPALRIRISGKRLATYGSTSWFQVATLTLDFERSTQPPDGSGRNLRPGQCSPADFALRDFDTRQIQDTVRAGSAETWDKSPQFAETRPDSDNIPLYLKDPDHYWSFAAGDSGDGHLGAAESRHWKPEFYKGAPASTTVSSPAANAALAGVDSSAMKTRAVASHYGGIGMTKEGHSGSPVAPTPAGPAPPVPPPVVAVPAVPVVFSPPLLEDNAQLWACADAAAAEAELGACSGEASGQAYCRLRDAQSGPDLVVADAQPDVAVRAVNGDVCQGDACRVVSQLQCDR